MYFFVVKEKNKSKVKFIVLVFYLISFNMDEKHDQTVAMLNDENHPPQTRINDNRAPLTKVISKTEI